MQIQTIIFLFAEDFIASPHVYSYIRRVLSGNNPSALTP